jgi:Raf kinase inhibitor-like YbhB/YbcL family protein
MTLTLSSLAFAHRGHIPAQYTCDGANTPPPLQWSNVPAGAKSLALIVDDPDAPDPKAPTHTFVHWVVYNLPPSATGLGETEQLPAGTREGTNDSKKVGYIGPCPPIGRHRYFFKLYALDTTLGNLGTAPKRDLETAMRAHVLEHTELVGLYERAPIGAGGRRPR